MIKIEKGIPIPEARGEYYRALSGMEVSESFLVKCDKDEELRLRSRIWSTINNSKKAGKPLGKFTVRRVNGGLRVWKTENA